MINKRITRDTDGLTKVPRQKSNWMKGFVITPPADKDRDMRAIESERMDRIQEYKNWARR